MTAVIRVENIGKEYIVGQHQYGENFRERLQRFLLAPLQRFKTLSGDVTEDLKFQALQDVSFEVPEGQILGLIGANGAGKSTLLKILSRITPPTRGKATLEGTVGSLLEVGVGFNRELTGRENIFLNGAILGMRRHEINKELDAIVDFAGVEQFLDTPVKRYSSGMYVRLAFSVAAHLKTDILLVDEVLAVGDKSFQEKCLGKMDELSQGGRTIIFVSHNLPVVENLCERVLVMQEGRLAYDGNVRDAISAYTSAESLQSDSLDLNELPRRSQYRHVLRSIRISDHNGETQRSVSSQQALTVEIDYDFGAPPSGPHFGFSLETATGLKVLTVSTRQNGCTTSQWPARGTIRCFIPSLPLRPGVYFVSVGCGERNLPVDGLERCTALEVKAEDVFGTGHLEAPRHGHVIVPATIDVKETPS